MYPLCQRPSHAVRHLFPRGSSQHTDAFQPTYRRLPELCRSAPGAGVLLAPAPRHPLPSPGDSAAQSSPPLRRRACTRRSLAPHPRRAGRAPKRLRPGACFSSSHGFAIAPDSDPSCCRRGDNQAVVVSKQNVTTTSLQLAPLPGDGSLLQGLLGTTPL